MKIAFLSNKLTLRGTEVSLYDYADCNELILKNQSVVITRDIQKHPEFKDIHQQAYDKFNARFPVFYYETNADIDAIVEREKIDVLFIEKAGGNEGLMSSKCKNLIHCVFTTTEPHGDLYTCLSDFINQICGTNVPVINYMVRVHPTTRDFRDELGIPRNAIVFGTYSGADCFDIDYIRHAVQVIGHDPSFSNIYFLFLNIDPFGQPSNRILFLPGTANMEFKRMFINTCDAMLYGRNGGETFGLSCGEFSLCDKPVIGRSNEHSKAHLLILGEDMIKHSNYQELYEILTTWPKWNKDVSKNGYKRFTPENVMKEFQSCLTMLGYPGTQ
jgi:hypothetical protein